MSSSVTRAAQRAYNRFRNDFPGTYQPDGAPDALDCAAQPGTFEFTDENGGHAVIQSCTVWILQELLPDQPEYRARVDVSGERYQVLEVRNHWGVFWLVTLGKTQN